MSRSCNHRSAAQDVDDQFHGVCPICLFELGLAPSEHDQTAVRMDSDTPDQPPEKAPVEPVLTPGSILGRRFRIVAHVGSGGMGDVYRADDLKLGQSVALKFLRPELEKSSAGLSRLYSEVRLGRQIAHPNVCRVYDVVELENRHCVVMEYIDGENMASLLLRVGRISPEYALRIGRQLCAALAASHRAGIVHGDLKPANVMIDGRGSARITDFGLARIAGEVEDGTIAGTVAYMAPEQLDGHSGTERSDVYALGLILWELYAGEPLRTTLSISEARLTARRILPATTADPAIPPEVDEIIRRCLAPEPDERPATAAHLLAAFPGRDPLQAALAAGDTPSPELVAAEIGPDDAPSPKLAVGAAFAATILLLALVLLSSRFSSARLAAMPTSPAALGSRAAALARDLAPPLPLRDRAWRFIHAPAGPPLLHYRQSAEPLAARVPDGAVAFSSVPEPGMIDLTLEPDGRLRGLHAGAIPGLARQEGSLTWDAPFSAAGLDLSQFTPSSLARPPSVPHDVAQEWIERDGSRRVQAAMLDGRIVLFRIIEPQGQLPEPEWKLPPIASGIYLGLLLVLLPATAYLARRNVRAGRVDRRGAIRVSASVFLCFMIWWSLTAAHRGSFSTEMEMGAAALGAGLFAAGRVWLGYVALEPFVRRRSPWTIVGWNRLVRGYVRDPRVGRDVLLGITAGILIRFLDEVRFALSSMIFGGLPSPDPHLLDALGSLSRATGLLFYFQTRAVFYGLFALFFLLLLEWALPKRPLAAAVWVIALSLAWMDWEQPFLDGGTTILQFALLYLLLERFGLLSLVAALYARLVLSAVPISADADAWFFGTEVLMIGFLAAIAAWALRVSLGQPLPDGRLALG